MSNTLKNFKDNSQVWIENSPVCTKILDVDFNLQYMSNAGVEALKIDDITDFYGKPYPLEFYPDSFKNPMMENLIRVKTTGETITQEASIQNLERVKLWYQSTLSPVFKTDGTLDYIMVISLDITKRKKAEAKDVYLKEIHHRIKNNLQIVSSLLSLQAQTIDSTEFKGYIQDSQQRIAAIALVHEKLYQSVVGEVNVQPYIKALFANISATYHSKQATYQKNISIDDFKLKMDHLVPCSLIINEIITNIFKYGFDKNPNPSLKISIKKVGATIAMVIADNGKGLPEGLDKESSLGMVLIDVLASQLDATLQVDSDPNTGLCYSIAFSNDSIFYSSEN